MTSRISYFSGYTPIPADTQASILPVLKEDVIRRIADFSFSPEDAASRVSLKAVSNHFRDLDISPIRRRQWELLLEQPPGLVDIPSEMRYIEETTPIGTPDRYTHLFRRLMSVFCSLGVPIKRGDILKATPSDYAALQDLLADRQLQLCWPEMKEKICTELGYSRCFYLVPSDDANASTIRTFLEKKDIKIAIASVQSLYLRIRNLISLPKEITLFSNLRTLFLESNQIISLPAHSFLKRVKDQSTPFVYNEVPAFPFLDMLVITALDRSHPFPRRGIHQLPPLSIFPSLTYINFDVSTLTSLASVEKGWFNRFREDPLEISLKGCKVYDYMMDSYYRPSELSNFKYNKIYHLRRYNPTSVMGKLYHTMLYTNATMQDLKKKVAQLPLTDKQLFFYCIWKYSSDPSKDGQDVFEWGERHCFADEHLFRKCIGLMIKEKLLQINYIDRHRLLGAIDQVYQNLWDQYEEFTGTRFEESWVENHKFNNFCRLADAMSAVQVHHIEYFAP